MGQIHSDNGHDQYDRIGCPDYHSAILVILIGYHHILFLESRSGRVRAELGRYDLELVSIEQAAFQASSTAYSPVFDAEMNRELRHALEQSMLLVETIPGTEAEGLFELADGRRAVARRILAI